MEEVKETKEKKVRKPRAKKEVAGKEEAAKEVAATVAVAETAKEEAAEKKPTQRRTRKKKAEETVSQPVGTPLVGEKEEPKTEEPAAKKEEKKEEKKAPVKRTRRKKAEAVAEMPAPEKAPVEETKAEGPAREEPVKEPAKEAESVEKAEKAEPLKKAKEKVLTRAERIDSLKALVRETLRTERKWSELLDDVVKAYLEKNPAEKGGNVNDVNGRVGSIIGQMKKDGEVIVEGGVAKLNDGKEVAEKAEEKAAEPVEKKPEVKPEVKSEEKPEAKAEEKKEEKKEEGTVYDLSSFFSPRKPAKTEQKEPALKTVERVLEEKTEEVEKAAASREIKTAVKENAAEKKPASAAAKPVVAAKPAPAAKRTTRGRTVEAAKTRDPLKEAFLKKLRSLGGDYFEYYSVYLLEKYSRRNGRRLESLRVSGGDHDGGIDGEIEVSDRLGFRETLYVQAKNWEPTDEKWMVGETLLQQFIGAVAYRKAKEGKQHARGVFMTTSRFTPEAKEMLEKMSDQFVGFDGDELYEAAKECAFGLKEENGVWKTDEKLLSGEKAFFNML